MFGRLSAAVLLITVLSSASCAMSPEERKAFLENYKNKYPLEAKDSASIQHFVSSAIKDGWSKDREVIEAAIVTDEENTLEILTPATASGRVKEALDNWNGNKSMFKKFLWGEWAKDAQAVLREQDWNDQIYRQAITLIEEGRNNFYSLSKEQEPTVKRGIYDLNERIQDYEKNKRLILTGGSRLSKDEKISCQSLKTLLRGDMNKLKKGLDEAAYSAVNPNNPTSAEIYTAFLIKGIWDNVDEASFKTSSASAGALLEKIGALFDDNGSSVALDFADFDSLFAKLNA